MFMRVRRSLPVRSIPPAKSFTPGGGFQTFRNSWNVSEDFDVPTLAKCEKAIPEICEGHLFAPSRLPDVLPVRRDALCYAGAIKFAPNEAAERPIGTKFVANPSRDCRFAGIFKCAPQQQPFAVARRCLNRLPSSPRVHHKSVRVWEMPVTRVSGEIASPASCTARDGRAVKQTERGEGGTNRGSANCCPGRRVLCPLVSTPAFSLVNRPKSNFGTVFSMSAEQSAECGSSSSCCPASLRAVLGAPIRPCRGFEPGRMSSRSRREPKPTKRWSLPIRQLLCEPAAPQP